MTSLRSHRLEAVFGALISNMSYANVAALVASNTVPEDYDLDFKRELYGYTDSERRKLAGDVAAMANTSGGVIALGVDEDDQARAIGIPGVTLSDDEHNRMLKIVASEIAPPPPIDIVPLEDPVRPGTGVYLIVVPRSPGGPHGVRINDGYRYPRRTGRVITYLTEPEIAYAYRQRFVGLQSRLEAAAEHEEYLRIRLYRDQAFVAITVVPDLDGYVEINARTFRAFQDSVAGTSPLIAGQYTPWRRTFIRAGRLIADAGVSPVPTDGRFSGSACVLHQSGAGTIAIPLPHLIVSSALAIDTYSLVNAIMSGLVFLARHARDRAGTGGNASLRAIIWPIDPNQPKLGLVQIDRLGFRNPVGSTSVSHPPALAAAVADVDDLAVSGPEMLMATYTLCTGLVQEFGYPEIDHITRDGQLQMRFWPAEVENSLRSWAAQVGVSATSSDTTTNNRV